MDSFINMFKAGNNKPVSKRCVCCNDLDIPEMFEEFNLCEYCGFTAIYAYNCGKKIYISDIVRGLRKWKANKVTWNAIIDSTRRHLPHHGSIMIIQPCATS